MSMEISNRHGFNYSNKVQTEQTAKAAERAEEAAKSKEKGKPDIIPAPKDEYISSEKSGKKPSGLYHMGQDENGNPKIVFDDPKKAEEAEDENSKGAKLKGESDSDRVQVTIGNMDKVKNEIKKLKEEKKQLEQQLKMAAGNEQKTKELEAKLARIEAELSVKDTAEYKKQHAEYTTEG
ncbi:MAG: hypothetical protein NC548_61710 [Lachnospiraceae bacterium]|nr:hypothetical protein [Lachnospiraceae bacterium]